MQGKHWRVHWLLATRELEQCCWIRFAALPCPEHESSSNTIQKTKWFWTENCCCRISASHAAAGLSCLTGEHLPVILVAFCEFARVVAIGESPTRSREGIRLGRMTALSKPDGGRRGERQVLRNVAPEVARPFAISHDLKVHQCLCQIIGVDPDDVSSGALQQSTLPFHLGGLGLASPRWCFLGELG